MKYAAIALALAALFATAARADELGGISGTVVDRNGGQPVAGAEIYYYRAPYSDSHPNQIMALRTNRHGFFSDITLQPGRYVVMARLPGKVEGCSVDDVTGGEVVRMRMEIGRDSIMCYGPRVHPALVDPNATSDVYRI